MDFSGWVIVFLLVERLVHSWLDHRRQSHQEDWFQEVLRETRLMAAVKDPIAGRLQSRETPHPSAEDYRKTMNLRREAMKIKPPEKRPIYGQVIQPPELFGQEKDE